MKAMNLIKRDTNMQDFLSKDGEVMLDKVKDIGQVIRHVWVAEWTAEYVVFAGKVLVAGLDHDPKRTMEQTKGINAYWLTQLEKVGRGQIPPSCLHIHAKTAPR